MSPVQASCPACGAPITFNYANSFVLVCEFCNSAVARKDRSFEDLGKVVDLIETDSPLDLGLKGTYQGISFEISGHVQIKHQAGGFWDEWYGSFSDGRWGWISEAQGRIYITFIKPAGSLPNFDRLQLGKQVVGLPGVRMVVAELGEAELRGAKGEIPYRFDPGERYKYADLSGENGEFGTLDYSEQLPLFFIGQETTLQDLGLASARIREKELKTVSASQLNCPNCAGPMELRAPDKSERVVCGNCGSLLDVSQGKLRFLKVLDQKYSPPSLKLGAVGNFYGYKMTVVGYMGRSVHAEGIDYPWEEYLLYNAQQGFHWLVCNNHFWMYVKPVPTGQVKTNIYDNKKISYHNKTFKVFDSGNARVNFVLGEFYWKVEQGEMAYTSDYIAPPEMLSCETSRTGEGQGEINWSLGKYLTTEDVEKAFEIKALPRPNSWSVGPIQPFGLNMRSIYLGWFAFSTITIVLWIFFAISSSHQNTLSKTFEFQPLTNNTDSTQTVFSEPFEVAGRKNIYLEASSNTTDNSWIYFEGDIINDDTGLVQSFSLPIEYYYGVEGGESWSEGSKVGSIYLPALPAGKYILRVEAQWGKWQEPANLNINIEQGVARAWHPILILILLSIIPMILLIKKYSFEVRRWKDSPYNPYASQSSD